LQGIDPVTRTLRHRIKFGCREGSSNTVTSDA
jgi:hypothetical protein